MSAYVFNVLLNIWCGVAVKIQESSLKISKFDLSSRCYVYFRIKPLEKAGTPLNFLI